MVAIPERPLAAALELETAVPVATIAELEIAVPVAAIVVLLLVDAPQYSSPWPQ